MGSQLPTAFRSTFPLQSQERQGRMGPFLPRGSPKKPSSHSSQSLPGGGQNHQGFESLNWSWKMGSWPNLLASIAYSDNQQAQLTADLYSRLGLGKREPIKPTGHGTNLSVPPGSVYRPPLHSQGGPGKGSCWGRGMACSLQRGSRRDSCGNRQRNAHSTALLCCADSGKDLWEEQKTPLGG